MKFFCEYCGNRIDADKDPKCPNCGASYKKNKKFIELETEKKNQAQENKENAQKVVKHVFGFFAFSGVLSIIPIILFLIVFITIIIIGVNVATKTQNDYDKELNKENINEIIEDVNNKFEDTKEQKDIVVNLDEFAETKEYKVKVTKYESVKDRFNRLEDGYEYIKFYLLVENKSNKQLTKEDVNCVVDGIAQTNEFSSGYSDLPMFISKGLTVKGTATFEVPKNATSYDIKYGDYVTIHIQK